MRGGASDTNDHFEINLPSCMLHSDTHCFDYGHSNPLNRYLRLRQYPLVAAQGCHQSDEDLWHHGGSCWVLKSYDLLAGNSEEKLGGAACCAVKRTNLDARIAKCAQRTGANLKEGFEVTKGSTLFDKETALWHVTSSEVSWPCFPLLSQCLILLQLLPLA